MKLNNEKDGVIYSVLSYVMWGITPIYWKLIQHVSSGEILAQRVFWSFVFMLVLLLITGKWQEYVKFMKEIIKKPKLFLSLFIASVLISANWGIFMWAVIEGRILEASLGQYINPLTSMLLGVIVLKEKLNGAQILAFMLAGIGVLTMLGILQYISPTLSLMVGVFLYHEALTKAHFIAFIFIWSALGIYTFSSVTKWSQQSKEYI